MFIREVKNRSGSISIQIISKVSGRYKVVKTIGSGLEDEEILLLKQKAKHELAILENQYTLFISHEDSLIESYISTLSNSQVRVVGSELIFSKIYKLNITLPQSKVEKKILLKLNDEQKILISIIEKIL
ncbi:MAG: hypothetical protein ISS16_12230 [Ignavibacteria bacterium]|nr:hypothetical protein [Ignavibacteria bacterium]